MNPTISIVDWLIAQIIYLAVQATQKFNQTLADFNRAANSQWDTPGTDQFYAILVGDQVTITDAMQTLAEIGTGGDEASVAADTNAYINTGDGAPIDVPSRAINEVTGLMNFQWGDLDFGTGLTITGFASVVILRGNVASPQTTDEVVWHFDADDGAAEVSVSNGALNITAPASNNWFAINDQA